MVWNHSTGLLIHCISSRPLDRSDKLEQSPRQCLFWMAILVFPPIDTRGSRTRPRDALIIANSTTCAKAKVLAAPLKVVTLRRSFSWGHPRQIMLILAAIVEHSPYCNYRPITPWFSTTMAEFQQPEFRVTKTWKFCKRTQLRQREGGQNRLPRLQTPTEVRSGVLLLHHRQSHSQRDSSHYPKCARSQATTNQPGVGNDAQECR